MAKLFSHARPAFFIFLFCCLISAALQAQTSPCTTCDITITPANQDNDFDVADKSVCITGGVNFIRSLNNITNTTKICLTGNSTFNGNLGGSPGSGTSFYVEQGSVFNFKDTWALIGQITNYGEVHNTTGYTTTIGTVILDNYGIASSNSMTLDGKVIINNYKGGFFKSNSIQSTDNAHTVITNYGTIEVSGFFSFNKDTIHNYSIINQFTTNAVVFNGGYVINHVGGSMHYSGTLTLNPKDGVYAHFLNEGTLNLANDFSVTAGDTLTNNGNIQIELYGGAGTWLNMHGVWNNNGYVYSSTIITSSNTAVVNNTCTMVALGGFALGGSWTNSGYMIIPSYATASTEFILQTGYTFNNTSTGWVQGGKFTNNGTIQGEGNFCFTGVTTNNGTFRGTGSLNTINFYDSTNAGFAPNQYFDNGITITSDVTKEPRLFVDINARATGCTPRVFLQGMNTECAAPAPFDGLAFSQPTNLIKNGNFSSPIVAAVGNSYPDIGPGTTYTFADGSTMVSQTDYNGSGFSEVCNRGATGNSFAIIAATAADRYLPTGTCDGINQIGFPGHVIKGVSATSHFMALAGNTAGHEYLAYEQTVTGLTPGKQYTFYFYLGNLRESYAANTQQPIIRLRIGGASGYPDGVLGKGPVVLDEAASQTSSPLGGWQRVAYNFTATSSTEILKITDAAFNSSTKLDDWCITALGLIACQPSDNDTDGVPDYIDIDGDNDGVTDVNELAYPTPQSFVWQNLTDPTTYTITNPATGIRLNGVLRNPYGLTTTVVGESISGYTSPFVRMAVNNWSDTSQIVDYIFRFSKKVTNVNFSINDIDYGNIAGNSWQDSIFVVYYYNGRAFYINPDQYTAGSNISANISTSNFTAKPSGGDAAPDAASNMVTFNINAPYSLDSIAIRMYNRNALSGQNSQGLGGIYISSVNSFGPADADSAGGADNFDTDSDNDGIPDVVENYGTDTNGDGRIDCSINGTSPNVNTQGLANCLVPSGGLTMKDFDGDAFVNQKDLDSDNDGIPDILEVQGTDANNNGMADNITDSDGDGLVDAYDSDPNNTYAYNTSVSLLLSGSDANSDGIAESWPYKNIDQAGYANAYDLDADADGVCDAYEAGFPNSVTGWNGTGDRIYPNIIKAQFNQSLGYQGWASAIRDVTTGTLTLLNTDNNLLPDYIDIDSDNDGITDNVEAQSTNSYIVPSGNDTDGDGIDDLYDGTGYGGDNWLQPHATVRPDVPDYINTDSDGDTAIDLHEASGYGYLKPETLPPADTDGDGLLDLFDSYNVNTLPEKWRNVTNANMNTNGEYNTGPEPSGSDPVLLVMGISDRAWRDIAVLPLVQLNLNAVLNQNTVNVQWNAVNEINLQAYHVLRSMDGRQYTKIATVAAANIANANYSWPDNLAGINTPQVFYKIEQVAKDGKVYITPVVAVTISTEIISLKLFPNPASKYASLVVNSNRQQTATIQIVNMQGQIVQQYNQLLSKGVNNFTINGIETLSDGVYEVQLVTASGIQHTRMVKRK
ncbi:MAG TPA: T9SS type A sorting domain-containing protein [Phnomibacter sp.]|nr:T9SS type A sorting domain-containing protein [Phnomibacter sp.]